RKSRETLSLLSRPVGYRLHSSPFLGSIFLLQNSRELLGALTPAAHRVHPVGSLCWEPDTEDPDLAAWLNSFHPDWPVLYVVPGPPCVRGSFWPYLVAATEGKPIRVVAAMARMDKEMGAIPENYFVRPFVPQSHVLRVAVGSVSSGTTTPVLGALE